MIAWEQKTVCYTINADPLHFFTRVNKNILHSDTYQFEVELSKQKTASTVVSGVQFNFNAPNNVMSVGHFDSYSISSLK